MSSSTSAMPSFVGLEGGDPEGGVGEIRCGRWARRGGAVPPAPPVPASRHLRGAPCGGGGHFGHGEAIAAARFGHGVDSGAAGVGSVAGLGVGVASATPRAGFGRRRRLRKRRGHPSRFALLRSWFREPACETLSRVAGWWLAAPFPEELPDLGHVGAAGDVLDRLVVDGHDGGADEGLAVEIGELHLDRGLLAGLVFLGGGQDLDVEHALLRRDDDSRGRCRRPCRR